MKSLLLSVLIAISAVTSIAKAQDQYPILPLVSAVLVSPEYAEAIAARVVAAGERGKIVQITNQSILRIENEYYVYLALQERPSAIIPEEPVVIGDLVAHIVMPIGGAPQVGGVFFKPAAEGPIGGGASVGN